MDIRTLDDTLHTAPQIGLSDLKSLAAKGYRAVVSNRPDAEEPGQPTAVQIAAAARSEGLEFRHIPVTAPAIGEDAVAAFSVAIAELPQPILGFCRTGTRTTLLWALAKGHMEPADALIATARAAGYDITGLKPRLEALAR